MACDHLLLVPFEPSSAWFIDSGMRRSIGAQITTACVEALSEVEGYVGRALSLVDSSDPPLFGKQPVRPTAHRTLAAVALATHLELAGLSWAAIDPGARELGWWRKELRRLSHLEPFSVGVSTTFVMSKVWVGAFVQLVREIFPRARIIIGGYYYGTDSEAFLSLPGDVHCVGPAETRLPEIIQRLKDGGPLEQIKGLYLRRGGRMVYTGKYEPADLQELAFPDWRLAERIIPPIDLSRQPVRMGVETQRGCIFKCTFCTHRTLSLHEATSIDMAARRILDTARVPYGDIQVADATATFPRARWEAILQKLIEKGGSPHPIWAFARVSDISERGAELMARAGVGVLFIGQESGDQQMLDLMRKGTKISHVKPAMAALDKHGIRVIMGMIHGFPRETPESAHSTRQLLMSVNEGLSAPVTLLYALTPFQMLDFASIAQEKDLRADEHHFMSYKTSGMSADEITHHCMTTLIEVSRVRHAPVCDIVLYKTPDGLNGLEIARHPACTEIHSWLKAVEQGMGIFMQRRLHGTAPDLQTLRDVKRRILSVYRPEMGWRSLPRLASARGRARLVHRLRNEWVAEGRGASPGPLSRVLAAARVLADSARIGEAAAALRFATLPQPPAMASPAGAEGIGMLASKLVEDSVAQAVHAKFKRRDDSA